jgi:hypothetical protein
MRMLMRFHVPVEAGNLAVRDGSLEQVLKSTMDRLKPEAAYFFAEGGERGGFVVFDMTDVSQIPVIAEPLFTRLNARAEFTPVMNAEDLQKALRQVAAEL